MSYTIKQVADLAHISVRTLHYYDQIGLLEPAGIEKNGYRRYEEADLAKLQQILFFRELDMPLQEIKKIISNKAFDQKAVLEDQRRLLELERQRLSKLIKTITTTINHMNKKSTISNQDLYEGFDREEMAAYATEAKERWGHTEAYKQSQERTKHWTKEDYKRISEEGNAFTQTIADAMPKGIDDTGVQELIQKHYDAIKVFYDCGLGMYQQLGAMYIQDERFKAYYEKFAPGLAQFMKEAIDFYCQTHKKKD